MLTKPRMVCGCQPVASMISASVVPLARFISAITSAFLLARSAVGLACFFALAVSFAGFPLLDLRLAFGCSVSGPALTLSIELLIIRFLRDRVAVVTSIAQVRRNRKRNLHG